MSSADRNGAPARGTLFILSAPSGAGKSSLARALVEANPKLGVSISHTTRAPRPGEAHGVHYYFVGHDEFARKIAAGDFLEHAKVFDNFYGTSRAAVEDLLSAGKHVLLDIDWQGARRIKQQLPQARGIFILPPSLADLEQRLRNRKQDSDETIARRMQGALAEIEHYREFDHVIVNDDFTAALADLQAIINGRPAAVRPLGIDPQVFFAAKPGYR